MSDERNIQEARRRLKECQDSHELCGQAGLPPLPRRVIDVGNSDDSQTVNIHFSLPDERGSYTALSYCWGKVSQMTSTVKSIGNLENGVPLSHMSKTVQDAVEITRALGIRYLWVDALCIIQDSPGDIAHEIGSMGNIYKNATLTIVAAHSEGAHLGFIGRNAPFEGCELPFLLPDNTLGTIIAVPGGLGPRMPPLPLDTRAWTMQEQMLSTRHLVFNLHGIGWKCQLKDYEPLFSSPFETFPGSTFFVVPRLPPSSFTGIPYLQTASLAEERELWEKIIEEYCKRKLTYFEDRLPALAGVAAQLQDFWQDTYVAGLWTNFLIDHLSWQIVSTSIGRYKDSSKNVPYIAPSWSWISTRYEIRFSIINRITASLHGFSIEPEDAKNAPLGKIKGGYINLLARVNDQKMTVRHPEMNREALYLDTGPGKLDPDVLYLKLGSMGTLIADGSHREAIGLLIKPVGDGTYRRVGMFEWRENALFENVPDRIFRLV
jgi:hypothetical protein